MLEKLQTVIEKENILKKKTLSSFEKASISKCEGGKYADGNRPSWFIYASPKTFKAVFAKV